jgi:hypothetical protein
MRANEISEILDRPVSRELLARDVTRLAYVAGDGTPRNAGPSWTPSMASRRSTSR